MSFVSADPKFQNYNQYPIAHDFTPLSYEIFMDCVELLKKKFHFKIILTLQVSSKTNKKSPTLQLNGINFFDLDCSGEYMERFRYDGELLYVHLAQEALSLQKPLQLEIRYTVMSPVAGLVTSIPDSIDPKRALYVAMDNESQKARYWLTCFDDISKKSQFTLHITTPKGFSVLGPGAPQLSHPTPDTTRFSFFPKETVAPYLVSVAIGNFWHIDLGESSKSKTPLNAYIAFNPNENSVDAEERGKQLLRNTFGQSKAIMEWLEEKLGLDFPYPFYNIVVLPLINGAAMENLMLSTFARHFVIDSEESEQEWGFYSHLIDAHEMSHSFFGNMVGCAWYSATWFKEGFANLIEWEYMKTFFPEDFYYWLYEEQTALDRECHQYVRPINSYQLLPDQHTYIGASFRLQMLKALVGDSEFWDITRRFLQNHWGTCISGEAFLTFFEKECGQNMSQFFEEWFQRAGYPILDVNLIYQLSSREATVVVSQLQSPVFSTLSFPVLIIDEEGREYTQILDFDHSSVSALHFSLGANPKQLIFDPKLHSLFSIESFRVGADVLAGNLFNAPTAYHRIQAASFLADMNNPLAIFFLESALEKEQHFGVRGIIGKLLAQHLRCDPLLKLLAIEDNPRTIKIIAQQMAESQLEIDPRQMNVLREKATSHKVSYGARRQLLRVIGVQRDPQDFTLLKGLTTDCSHLGFVRAGAYEGISEYRSEEALEFLIQNAFSEPDETRLFLLNAITNCSKYMSSNCRWRVVELLKKIMNTPEVNGTNYCKWQAAEGIVELGDASSLPVLRRFKGQIATQDIPRLEKLTSLLQSK